MMDIPFTAWLSRAAAALHGQGVAVQASRSPASFFRSLGGFAVRATAPTARRCATRWRCCRRGGAARVPEGRASTARRSRRCNRRGVPRCARVPIVPVGIAGPRDPARPRGKIPRFGRVVMVVGDPIVSRPRRRRRAARPGRGADRALHDALQVVFDERTSCASAASRPAAARAEQEPEERRAERGEQRDPASAPPSRTAAGERRCGSRRRAETPTSSLTNRS